MNFTATDMTREHYARPKVREIIEKFSKPIDCNGFRCLNGDDGWYITLPDDRLRLRVPDDYEDTTSKYRTLYALLDVMEPSVRDLTGIWDDIKHEAVPTLGTFRECVAYTLGADIDSIAHNMQNPATKAAVEALAGYLVKRLKEAGIEKSIHCLMSGGGVYVLLHHALCMSPSGLSGDEREEYYRIRTGAFKLLLQDIEHDFFQDHKELRGIVKIDKLTGQKRKFKCICSLHRKLPLVVVPLDPANISIDYGRAAWPLKDAVLEECKTWYDSFDVAESDALTNALSPYDEMMQEELKIRKSRAKGNQKTKISRLPEPLSEGYFPPCMKNILEKVAPGKGPHRALGDLASFLYQSGWTEEKAFVVWEKLAQKCDVESRIFDLWFGQMSCPNCKTLQKVADGYPNTGIGGLGYCVPDDNCKGCIWPGDYHLQKKLSEHSKIEGPKFNYVTKDDPVGTVGIMPPTGDGKQIYTVHKVVNRTNKETGETFKGLAWVSDCALRIDTETTCGSITEFTFKGVGAIDNRSVCFTLPAEDMATPAKFKAAIINAFGGKNEVGKLDYQKVQKLSQNIRLMQRIEVPCWREGVPLIPGIDFLPNIEYRLSAKIPACVYDGDLDAAIEIMRKLLAVNPFAPILITAIFGAPVYARWFKSERFGLGLWGLTNAFKTSMACISMSVYGVGYADEPSLKSGKANTTTYAASIIFALAGWLPQIYDNVKAVDSRDAIEYVGLMNAVLEGHSKNQGTKENGLRDGFEYACTPIVTGEVRPQDAATTSRIPDIEWQGTNAKLLREAQRNVKLMPVLGFHWLKFLTSVTNINRDLFDKTQNMKLEEFRDAGYTVAGRTATIYTLLKTVWELLEMSPMGNVFQDFRGKFITALDNLAISQGIATREETEAARFIRGLNQLMMGNPGLFMDSTSTKHIAGFAIGKSMPDGMWLMPDATLAEMGKLKIFTQIPTEESMTTALFRAGYLICKTNPDGTQRKKYQVSLNGAKVRGWYVKMEKPAFADSTVPEGTQPNGDGNPPMVTKKEQQETLSTQITRVTGEKEENLKEKKENNFSAQKVGTLVTAKKEKEINDSSREIERDIYSNQCSNRAVTSSNQTMGKIDMETPTSDITRIRIAARQEYGIHGSVDHRIIAGKLHLPEEQVKAWLEANYAKLPTGRYTQR